VPSVPPSTALPATPDHGAYAGADLGVGGIGGASTQGKGGGANGGGKGKTDIHGSSSFKNVWPNRD
jgi:hypothetical protein